MRRRKVMAIWHWCTRCKANYASAARPVCEPCLRKDSARQCELCGCWAAAELVPESYGSNVCEGCR